MPFLFNRKTLNPKLPFVLQTNLESVPILYVDISSFLSALRKKKILIRKKSLKKTNDCLYLPL